MSDNVVSFKDKIKEKAGLDKAYGMSDIGEEELDIFIEDFVDEIDELLRVEEYLSGAANDFDLELEFYSEDWIDDVFLDNPDELDN